MRNKQASEMTTGEHFNKMAKEYNLFYQQSYGKMNKELRIGNLSLGPDADRCRNLSAMNAPLLVVCKRAGSELQRGDATASFPQPADAGGRSKRSTTAAASSGQARSGGSGGSSPRPGNFDPYPANPNFPRNGRRNAVNMRSNKRQNSGSEQLTEPLACPYAKYHLGTNMACASLQFTRISDLYQHIDRKHVLNFYCVICHWGCTKEEEYDAHVEATSCQPAGNGPFPGPSPNQFDYICNVVKGYNTPKTKWESLFGQLFPGFPVPDPYYHGDWPVRWRTGTFMEFYDKGQYTKLISEYREGRLPPHQRLHAAVLMANHRDQTETSPQDVLLFGLLALHLEEFMQHKFHVPPVWTLWIDPQQPPAAGST